jgi:hypothetical protein
MGKTIEQLQKDLETAEDMWKFFQGQMMLVNDNYDTATRQLAEALGLSPEDNGKVAMVNCIKRVEEMRFTLENLKEHFEVFYGSPNSGFPKPEYQMVVDMLERAKSKQND